MEIMDGYNKYDNIYNNAYWAKHELDRPSRYFDMDYAKDRYLDYLSERQKNRTEGDIAFAEVLRKQPLRYKRGYNDNFKKLASEFVDNALIVEAEAFNQKNYPKTCQLRNTLIQNNRFRLDRVMPKLSKFQKIAMKFKAII